MRPPPPAPHALPLRSLLEELESSAQGLAQAEARRRQAHFGPNELQRSGAEGAWRRLARQFRQSLVVLLLAAAAVSLALGETFDALAIAAIVVLNGGLGFLQEERAARALEALLVMARPTARVLRDGHLRSLPACELVPGDVLALEAGDAVPADARLLEGVALSTQESALTGESTAVEKDAGAAAQFATPLAERTNSVFLGTSVATGRGQALVTATGMQTELGRIAALLEEPRPRRTPLQERLEHTGRMLALLCLGIVALLAVLYALRGVAPVEVLVLSISLAVAAVPEGLPAVVTIALALGMRRMAHQNALVRHLAGVETLGSVSVICTDKTGTLTLDAMSVRELHSASGVFHVAENGAEPPFRREQGPAPAADELPALIEAGLRCNHARLEREDDGRTTAIGDPTEVALLVLAQRAGLSPALAQGERVAFELPFDSERKRMSVALAGPGGRRLFVKGAAEVILERCTRLARAGTIEPLDEATRGAFVERAAEMATRALRVLALAARPDVEGPEEAERELVLLGLVGLQDPPRPEVPGAIRRCRAAGIRPVMITGDHPATGLAVAREIGLAGPGDRAVTGAELDGWSDERLQREVEQCPVFARTTAAHKLRLIAAWRARGAVVAMTGDGVNDAPALQEADIGIAMGKNGTDVTRAAADIVLLDDDFATIVAAVREGRGLFDNIRKAVHYLLTANAAELMLMVGTALVGWPIPLGAVQLLWINLVTDGLPALALGVEPTEQDVLERPPAPRRAPILSRADGGRVLWRGALLALAAGLPYGWALAHGRPDATAVAFAILVFAQLALAFAFRSPRRTLFQLGPRGNPELLLGTAATALLQALVLLVPALGGWLIATPLAGEHWPLVIVASLVPVTVLELGKLWPRRVAAARG